MKASGKSNEKRRILAVFLTVALMLSLLSANVYAEEYGYADQADAAVIADTDITADASDLFEQSGQEDAGEQKIPADPTEAGNQMIPADPSESGEQMIPADPAESWEQGEPEETADYDDGDVPYEVVEVPEDDSVEEIESELILIEKAAAPTTGNIGQFIFDKSISLWMPSAAVTLGDGTKIIVAIDRVSIDTGTKLRVSDASAPGSLPGGHGQIASGYLGYCFEFLDNNDNPLTGNFNFWVSITSNQITPAFDLFFKNGSSVSRTEGYSVSGTTISSTNGWGYYLSGIPYNGQAATVYSGEFQPLNITLPGAGGEYTIDYILRYYNVFVEGNYYGSHETGPVVVGGDVGMTSLGGFINYSAPDIQKYKHEAPSYIYQGAAGRVRQVSTNSNVPLYLGTAEIGKKWTVISDWWTVPTPLSAITDNYFYTSNFVDFKTAMSALENQANAIAKDPAVVTVDLSKQKGNGYEVVGNTLKLADGGSFKLTKQQLAAINIIDFTGFYNGKLVYVIVEDADAVTIPTNFFAGRPITQESQYEAMQNCNIVWILPNAKSVSANELTGHLVAPNADVKLTGGHWEGCVIARNLDASDGAGTEGHHWPLGYTKPTGQISLSVNKTVTGDVYSGTEDFSFTLSDANDPGTKGYQMPTTDLTKTAKNGGAAAFGTITFDAIGKYYFQIRETAGSTDGMTYDTSEKFAEVSVTLNKDGKTLDTDVKYGTSKKTCTQAALTVTNTYTKPAGSLKITKTIKGDVTESEASGAITFKVTGPDSFNAIYTLDKFLHTAGTKVYTLELKNLTPGQYTVEETTCDITGKIVTVKYSIDAGPAAEGKSANAAVVKNKTVNVDFEDDYKNTSVKISKVDITTQKELPGATIQIVESGTVVREWVSTDQPKEITGLKTGVTYLLKETAAPLGYDLAAVTSFSINADGTLNKGTTKVNANGVMVIEDTAIANGSIKVTKQTLSNGYDFKVENQTYYTALFSDSALTNRVSEVKAIHLTDAYKESVTFSDLPYGTYYVAETTKNGTPVSTGPYIEEISYDGQKAVLTASAKTAKATIYNSVTANVLGSYRDKEVRKKFERENKEQTDSGQTAQNNSTNAAVRTGDQTPILPMIILFLIAGFAMLYLMIQRKRTHT